MSGPLSLTGYDADNGAGWNVPGNLDVSSLSINGAPFTPGGGGGTFGTAILTPVNATAGGDSSYLQWGDGASPLDAAPVYLDQYANVLDVPFSWLNISDPASPVLTPGSYVISASVSLDAAITTTDYAVTGFYVSNNDHPGSPTGGTTVPTNVSYDPYGYNLMHEELVTSAGGVLGVYIQAVQADGAGTFGIVQFRCGVAITKLSPEA